MQQKNVIVIMADSLQFNYLGCYGNDWIKTPNIDRLAREGIVFENAYCEGLPTVPCRRAMHTGRFTLPVKGWSPLDMEDTTVADLCWGRGIDTALVFDCPMYRLCPSLAIPGDSTRSGSSTGTRGPLLLRSGPPDPLSTPGFS